MFGKKEDIDVWLIVGYFLSSIRFSKVSKKDFAYKHVILSKESKYYLFSFKKNRSVNNVIVKLCVHEIRDCIYDFWDNGNCIWYWKWIGWLLTTNVFWIISLYVYELCGCFLSKSKSVFIILFKWWFFASMSIGITWKTLTKALFEIRYHTCFKQFQNFVLYNHFHGRI